MSRDKNIWLDGIMGVIVGDALGVPVEFMDREELENEPVEGMRGYGTYNLPKGSWSDDSSMTLATLHSLKSGYHLEDIMNNFVLWLIEGEYTPFGEAFDIGNTCYDAIARYMLLKDSKSCGGMSEHSNGNGSLMRIMPICLYMYEMQKEQGLTDDEAIKVVHEVSALTHAHMRSKIGCGLYYFIVKSILEGNGSLQECLQNGIDKGFAYYKDDISDLTELTYYGRTKDLEVLKQTPEEEIKSYGYVVVTLEAALWSLLQTESYQECTLKAVNLGHDTDTVAAVAGGLAGLYYGYNNIPTDWLNVIARREWVEGLCRSISGLSFL